LRRIVYLHGFNSSPASKKANQLLAYLAARGMADAFAAPNLYHRPALAMREFEAQYGACNPDDLSLVGSSLGGFYATYLTEKYGFKSILVNPAVGAHLSLATFIGPQVNLYTGDKYEFTSAHIEELKALAVAKPKRLDRYWLMVETGDETLDYRQAVAFYCGAKQLVIEGGDHGFNAWQSLLPEVVAFAGST
jgi:predicted esterase YcpF (UPF0227 family)